MTRDLVQAANIARELTEARKLARRLFGESYDAKVEPWRVLVRDLARVWGCRAIEVAPRIEREGKFPANPVALLAAVVDVVEEGAEVPA